MSCCPSNMCFVVVVICLLCLSYWSHLLFSKQSICRPSLTLLCFSARDVLLLYDPVFLSLSACSLRSRSWYDTHRLESNLVLSLFWKKKKKKSVCQLISKCFPVRFDIGVNRWMIDRYWQPRISCGTDSWCILQQPIINTIQSIHISNRQDKAN